VHRGRADHAPPLERDTRAHTVFRCRERPIYTPAGVQPATRDLLHAVMTWLGRYAHPAPRGKTVSHAKCRTVRERPTHLPLFLDRGAEATEQQQTQRRLV
jgi:hypothetical protein